MVTIGDADQAETQVDPSHNGSYTVSWGSSPGATRYELQESANGGAWAQKYSGSTRSQAFSNRADGSYRYRVRACNATTGCGAWRALATETVLHPPASAPTLSAPAQARTRTTYTVSWSAVTGASDYRLKT